LAEWIGVTSRRIGQLVHEGVLPRESRGKYPLKSCIQAYCRWKDALLLKRGAGSEINEERLLTARLERRRLELKFAQLEGGLVTVEHHEKVMGEAFALVRTNMRNLPGALAPRIAGLDDPRDVERILVGAVDSALRSVVAAGKAFADDELPLSIPGRRALIRAGITTTSELMAASDLASVKGVGPKTRKAILAWVGA
jgi:hypothetical protein